MEVNGESADRAETLAAFGEAGMAPVLCNSMLLTEGWDCPSVDCVVVLRPTKVRSLYRQMVGRGTRLSPETGKTELLLLDFLWHVERHEPCRPAHLIAESEDVARAMTERLEQAGCPEDLEEVEREAAKDVVEERERALAEQLSAMRKRKRKLVDPLQFEMSIASEDLTGYVPQFAWGDGPRRATRRRRRWRRPASAPTRSGAQARRRLDGQDSQAPGGGPGDPEADQAAGGTRVPPRRRVDDGPGVGAHQPHRRQRMAHPASIDPATYEPSRKRARRASRRSGSEPKEEDG